MDNGKLNKINKAMIMAAGVGSRLDPLTKYIPKPIVPIANKPVMDILFERLAAIGITDVIANTYYQAEKIIDRYKSSFLGINFNYIKEETLSGTAGGLKKCQHFFNEGEDFLVMSADGLFDTDLKKGIEIHKKSGAIATIGIKRVPTSEIPNFGVVVTDENGYITEFQEKPSIEEAKNDCINTGIYIFNYKIFDYIPAATFYDFAKNVFPKLLEKGEIDTFEVDGYWSDIGTIEQYKQSTKDVLEGRCNIGSLEAALSELPASVELLGHNVIGKNCKIGENVILENCIIWDNVTIDDGQSFGGEILI